MSLETSFALFSLDPSGYPIGLALNALHLLTRLSVLVAALPEWFGGWGARRAVEGRYRSAQELADADARLEALRRQAVKAGGKWGLRIVSAARSDEARRR